MLDLTCLVLSKYYNCFVPLTKPISVCVGVQAHDMTFAAVERIAMRDYLSLSLSLIAIINSY